MLNDLWKEEKGEKIKKRREKVSNREMEWMGPFLWLHIFSQSSLLLFLFLFFFLIFNF